MRRDGGGPGDGCMRRLGRTRRESSMLLEGKVALVTGSAGGIGLGIAQRFGREGAKIVVCDVDGDRLPEAARAVQEAGGEALPVQVDLSVEADVERLFGQTIDRF